MSNSFRNWTGPIGHVVDERWVPTWFRAGIAELTSELDEADPPGLAAKRTALRQQGRLDREAPEGMLAGELPRLCRVYDQLLQQRVELLVGAQLLRAGVLTGISVQTPDFECRWQEQDFGVEVTTRTRKEAGTALHDVLELGMVAGPDVSVTLKRIGPPTFSLSPEKIVEIGQRVRTEITNRAAAGGEAFFGSLPVPELGLSVQMLPDPGFGLPMQRVNYEPLLDEQAWDHHWKMAALQIKDPIEAKGRKNFSVPSILVLDVTRLGEAGRMPPGARRMRDLFVSDGPVEPWTNDFQQVLDDCDLGALRGVLLARTTLMSQFIEPLCWRGEESMRVAAGAVIFGGQLRDATT